MPKTILNVRWHIKRVVLPVYGNAVSREEATD
jgi:hypothetical protein